MSKILPKIGLVLFFCLLAFVINLNFSSNWQFINRGNNVRTAQAATSSNLITSVQVLLICGDGFADPYYEFCDPGNAAKHYLPDYPSLLAYLKLQLDTQSDRREVGSKIGALLLDPSTIAGMKKMISLLQNDFVFNPTLIHLVTSKLSFHKQSDLKKREEELLTQFLGGDLSLEALLFSKNR